MNLRFTWTRTSKNSVVDEDDSDVDAIIARDLWKNHRLLPPASKFKGYWDVIMMILVLYNCIYIPMELAFEDVSTTKSCNWPHRIIDYLVDFLFFVDIFINFRTAYFDEDYEMVLDSKKIARQYLRGWFVLDFTAAFPFDLIILLIIPGGLSEKDAASNLTLSVTQSDPAQSDVAGVTGVFKISRLLRISRLLKKLDVVAAANAFRILVLMLIFLLVAHWFACIWWAVGYVEYSRCDCSQNISPTKCKCSNAWTVTFDDCQEPTLAEIEQKMDMCMSEACSITHPNFTYGTSWLQRVPGQLLDSSSGFGQQYASAMYWSLTTLMKTPWVGPDTVLEKVVAALAVLMGAILFAALLGNVTALVQSFDKGNAQKRDKITTLHQFNASRKVPKALQRKLFAYIDAEWNVTSGLDDSTVLAQLPSQLRGNIVASIYRDTLLKAPLCSGCSFECSKSLLLRLQPEICLQKEVLINREQLCQEMYCLMRGAVQISGGGGDRSTGEDRRTDDNATGGASGVKKSIVGKGKPSSTFRMIEKAGTTIGHVAPFEREVPRYPYLVTAVRQTHLVSLSRDDLRDVLSNFEGDDSKSVTKAIDAEHAKTVSALSSKRAERAAPVDQAVSAPSAVPSASGPNSVDYSMVTLRARVSAMEAQLAQCVDDMRAARECTEMLPHLVHLVKAAASKGGNGGA